MQQFSGREASIYSVFLEDEQRTLFERFIAENQATHLQELLNISGRLRSIGTAVGAREQYFKLKEGKPGDLVCALYDEPDKFLRLYCIRYGKNLIILGGGGPKNVAAWQEDPRLTEEVQLMMKVSNDIFLKMQDGEIELSEDGYDFEGDLNFNYDEEE